MVYTILPEILAVIKFGGLAPNDALTLLADKFGSMVQYCHTGNTYMHAGKIWRFKPNFPAIQY